MTAARYPFIVPESVRNLKGAIITMKKIFCLVLALCMIGAAALAEFDTSSTITVYSREDGSGTRSAFVELFVVEE